MYPVAKLLSLLELQSPHLQNDAHKSMSTVLPAFCWDEMIQSTESTHIEPGMWWHSILLGVVVSPCQKRPYSVEQAEEFK